MRLRSEDLDLPPATGLDAHHALVQFCLDESSSTRTQLLAGERPGPRLGRTDRRQRLWEGAVGAQMHLGKQDRHDANEHVTSIVNQLVNLASHSTWFADARLRAAAIHEVLDHQVLNADVPSRLAQRTWLEARARRVGRRPPGPAPLPPGMREDLRRRAQENQALDQQAQQAWDSWASNA